MSSVGFVQRLLRQKAVYWGNPMKDGYGGLTFDDPVEIDCRWEDRTQVFSADDGKGTQYIARSVIYVGQELDFDGMLFLGILADLNAYLQSGGSYENPINIDKAYSIRRFETVPRLGSATQFLYRAYLTPWLTF